MNRGVDRSPVFVDDESRVDFGRLLAENAQRFGVEVLAYCLMDNHYHLVVHCPQAALSASMQRLSSMFTRHLNDRVGRDGPVFRGRFTSRTITSSQYLASAVRYVHRNPLDLPAVDSVDGYRWSSHRPYLGYRRAQPWLRTDVVLDWFDDPAAFHRFVSEERAGPPAPDRTALPHVITNIGFLLRANSTDGRRIPAGDVRAAAFSLVEPGIGVDPDHVADALALNSPSARHSARTRARQRLATAPELADVATTAISLARPRPA